MTAEGTPGGSPLRVLVVDDSAYNRRSISEILGTTQAVQVVGKAADGEEALRLVGMLKPDAITLDLEMPRMDGFTFLRILMSKVPTPVIVVSSYSQKENVFKALELGAIDFVAKPDRYADSELQQIRQELVAKVLLVRSLRPSAVKDRVAADVRMADAREGAAAELTPPVPPRNIIAVASSTGGPTALLDILSRLPGKLPDALLIAQHMPAKFTRTFADRLDRRSEIKVSEAADEQAVFGANALVCPGSKCMELVSAGARGGLSVRVLPPAPEDRYVPSADRLFASVARVVGAACVGIVLTGMGDDGVAGARAIVDAGGVVIVESEETAVVHGMPGAVLRAGVPQRTLNLREIAQYLASLGS